MRLVFDQYGIPVKPSICDFGGSQTSTTTTSPWSAQAPYLQDIMSSASNLYSNYAPQYYPGSTVSPLNSAQNSALSGIESMATNGTPITGNAENFANSLETGGYLNSNPGSSYFSDLLSPASTQNSALNSYASGSQMNSNPYQDPTAQSIMSQVEPSIAAQFAGGNDMNNPAMTYSIAQGVTNALAPTEYNAYQTEQANQLNAAGQLNSNLATAGAGAGTLYNQSVQQMLGGLALAPDTQQLNYGNLSDLFNAGTAQQTQSQNELNSAVNAWNYNQMLPYATLGTYEGEITGAGQYPTSTTSTQTSQNPFASILGGLGGLQSLTSSGGLLSSTGLLGSLFGGAGAAGGSGGVGAAAGGLGSALSGIGSTLGSIFEFL